jgi:hypothetical protein
MPPVVADFNWGRNVTRAVVILVSVAVAVAGKLPVAVLVDAAMADRSRTES